MELPIETPPAPVDGEAVHCPLCTYDLRGLIESRCPECGYQFAWAELLDERLNTHPYLFEHYPRHNTESFLHTAVGGLDPLRFWRTLRPQMTPRQVRLIQYWVDSVFAILLVSAALFAIVAYNRWLIPSPSKISIGWPPYQHAVHIFDAIPTVRYWQPQLTNMASVAGFFAPSLLYSAALVVGWTLTTLLALMVFQESMAKAKIRPIHVARCVLYSFDIGISLALIGVISVSLQCLLMNADVEIWFWLLNAILLFFAGTKLWAAYRLYLGFEHAFWVVLSSQVISSILAFAILLNIGLVT